MVAGEVNLVFLECMVDKTANNAVNGSTLIHKIGFSLHRKLDSLCGLVFCGIRSGVAIDIECWLTSLERLDLLQCKINSIVFYRVLTKRCVRNSRARIVLRNNRNRSTPSINPTGLDIPVECKLFGLSRFDLTNHKARVGTRCVSIPCTEPMVSVATVQPGTVGAIEIRAT